MDEFKELPRKRVSYVSRSKIHSKGINDAPYQISIKVHGKRISCPYYSIWSTMLMRCYSAKHHKRQPTYIDCTVCKEWLTFSNFKSWMETQDWKGKCLDKDLINVGNKEYSPTNCIFVTQRINNLIETRQTKRGIYKLGVSWIVRDSKYRAQCNNGFTNINLGSYNSEQEAHEVYCKYKSNLIKEIAEEQTDLRLKKALIERANTIHLLK